MANIQTFNSLQQERPLTTLVRGAQFSPSLIPVLSLVQGLSPHSWVQKKKKKKTKTLYNKMGPTLVW